LVLYSYKKPPFSCLNDENPAKLYKEKALEKGREKETRGQGPKSRQAIHPKEANHKEIKGTTKYQNFHQLLDAY